MPSCLDSSFTECWVWSVQRVSLVPVPLGCCSVHNVMAGSNIIWGVLSGRMVYLYPFFAPPGFLCPLMSRCHTLLGGEDCTVFAKGIPKLKHIDIAY